MPSIVPHSLNSSTSYCHRPSGYDSILLFSVQSVRQKNPYAKTIRTQKENIQVDTIPSPYPSVQSVRKKIVSKEPTVRKKKHTQKKQQPKTPQPQIN